MVALAAYTLAFALAQTVEVRLAPDQPAPIFFTDEPLVVQVLADVNTVATPEIEAELPDGRRANWSAGVLELAPERPKWLTMDGLPVLRGPHVFFVRTAPGEPPVERALVRIDRPVPSNTDGAIIALAWPSPAARYAAQCVGAGVQVPLEWTGLDAEVANFTQPGNGPIHVRITASNGRHPRSVESAATALGARVDLWSVGGAISPREALREAAAVRTVSAQWGLCIGTPREAAAVLARASELPPQTILCAPEDAASIAATAARAGIERMPLLIELPAAITGTAQDLLGSLVESAMAPGRSALIAQESIETPEGFTGALSVLAAARLHLAGAKNLGRITEPGANESWIFRLGPAATPDTWCVVTIVRDAASGMAALAPGEGAVWNVLDGYGNPLGDAGRPDGKIVLPSSSADAWYVRGAGGSILREALAARVRALAAPHVAYTGELAAVAPETVSTVEALANYQYPAPVRLHFFSLLRSLPALEEGWRRGIVETRYAIPMIRDFAVMAELLAVLEQELNEPLLEPLDKTMDTCTEWMQRFSEPADASAMSAQRFAFLRDEVTRLVDEARALDAVARPIEAKAIAALAEWRARTLEPAATIFWPATDHSKAAEEAPAPPVEEEEIPTETEEDPE